jgi:hypothetical protein
MRSGITFLVVFFAFIYINGAYGQQGQTTPTRQSSIDAFTSGNFEEAYKGFSQLLEKYPKDPLYKYYSGASLVMLKRDPETAMTLLTQSVTGASVVRSLPAESYFYLGRAQQMCGKFTEAIASYNSFSEEAGRKAAREFGVPGFIEECEDHKGKVVTDEPAPSKQNEAPIPEVTKGPVAGEAVKKAAGIPVTQPVIPDLAASPLQNAHIATEEKKTIENNVPEGSSLPPKYEAILDEALKMQYKADSLTRLAADQKNHLDQVPEADKSALRVKIYQNEMQAASYQKSADARYSEAQARMNTEKDRPVHRDSVPGAPKTSVIQETIDQKGDIREEKPDTSGKTPPVISGHGAVVTLFQVLPKDAVYPDEAIKVDPPVPAGLIYRIQLAVFRNAVPSSFFKGITPVYGFKVPGGDKTNYYAGMFRRSADAKKALIAVKETGFKDAFIIALADKKPVSSDRAAVLENEWGNKSLITMNHAEGAADTITPALVFRVEVSRSPRQMKQDAMEALKTTAGSRGLDVLHLSDGNYVYLIGKFITFESAAEYADLLVRNNFRGAKVVAWLGNKEVPVETAKQLFKGLQ